MTGRMQLVVLPVPTAPKMMSPCRAPSPASRPRRLPHLLEARPVWTSPMTSDGASSSGSWGHGGSAPCRRRPRRRARTTRATPTARPPPRAGPPAGESVAHATSGPVPGGVCSRMNTRTDRRGRADGTTSTTSSPSRHERPGYHDEGSSSACQISESTTPRATSPALRDPGLDRPDALGDALRPP